MDSARDSSAIFPAAELLGQPDQGTLCAITDWVKCTMSC